MLILALPFLFLGGPVILNQPISPFPKDQIVLEQYSSEDVDYLARTMWGECRDKGCRANDYEGMKAVGHVINNRSKKSGKSIRQVVLAPHQFTVWSKGNANYSKIKRAHTYPKDSIEYEIWVKAVGIARDILSGASVDNTYGSTYYHNTSVNPGWSRKMRVNARLAGHIFLSPRH